MTLNRVRALWQNWPGSPGYTNFYVDPAVVNQTEIRTWFAAFVTYLPSGITIQVPNTGDQIDETTGAITGAWSGTANTLVTATGTGNYAGATGACVNWRSTTLVRGRRPIGRSFLVPLVAGSFDSGGTLATATLGGIQTASNALVTNLGGALKIWSRPKGGSAGSAVTVTAAQVPDLGVVLRTRRT